MIKIPFKRWFLQPFVLYVQAVRHEGFIRFSAAGGEVEAFDENNDGGGGADDQESPTLASAVLTTLRCHSSSAPSGFAPSPPVVTLAPTNMAGRVSLAFRKRIIYSSTLLYVQIAILKSRGTSISLLPVPFSRQAPSPPRAWPEN